MKTLILGGARSGKSRLAEDLAKQSGRAVLYVATAKPGDEEMRARIAHHKARRPPQWRLIEEPIALAGVLRAHASPDTCVVVDCLTLWLTNLLVRDDAARMQRERQALLAALPGLPGELILVSNETGCGVVPMGPLARRFVDEAGWLHQELAGLCERVTLTVAGLPLNLKGNLCMHSG